MGFAAGTLNTARFYKHFFLRHALRAGLLVLPHLLSWSCIRRVFETLFYPSKNESSVSPENKLPEPELLSIAVAEESQGVGVAVELYQKLDLFDNFKAWIIFCNINSQARIIFTIL